MGKSIGELVLLARQDDQNAINELYNQTFKKAYFVARTAIKSSDGDYSSQIEDILQDAYVKAFSSLDKLEDPEKFQGWLDTIVINRCKDFLKKKKPTLFSDMASENSDDGSILDFEDSRENDRMEFKPEETVDYGETKRLIAEMLDRMPEDQKMCLLMYYYEEMSVRQIAEAMDCSEGTIKSRLNYARKNLKGQVLELEKKGTKLYCMPLLPFLYWFFREQAAEFIGGTAAGAVAAGATGAAAGAAGQSVSTASASASVNAGQTAAAGQAVSSGAAQTTATGQTISAGAASGTAGSTGAGAGAASGAAGSGAAASSSAAGAAGAAAKTAAVAAGKASLGVGAKLAMVGAAVVIGGGGAAVASGKVPVDLPWEQGIDVSKFELDENGLLPKEAYDNKKNRKAVKSYLETLEGVDIDQLYVVDLDQDGVVELMLMTDNEGSYSKYYIDYEGENQLIPVGDGLIDEETMEWSDMHVAIAPGESRLVLNWGDSNELNAISLEVEEHSLKEEKKFGWRRNEIDYQIYTTDQLKEAEETLKGTKYLKEERWDEWKEETLLYPTEIAPLERLDISDHQYVLLFAGSRDDQYIDVIRPYIPAVDKEYAEEGEKDNWLATTLISYADYRNDKNREAVKAYADALRNDPRFAEIYSVYVVDVNQDGVVEFIVRAKEMDEMYYPYYSDWVTSMLSYDGSISVNELYGSIDRFAPPEIGVIPEENKIALILPEEESLYVYEYTMAGESATEVEDYYYDLEGNSIEAEEKINRIVLPDHIGGDDHLINYDSLYTTMLTEMESDEDNLYMYPFEGFYYGNHAVEAVKNEGYWFGE
ncbi:RNA polymerase sigma factor [Clostridium fessum]|uniref:RNA polymerase sigma factor n=1 Tax=Clostridium fessum TaxID=2126740 RepID=UPI0022E78A5F|nr:RNA polymerase sigma factor [Clostridium fessum]